MLIDVKPILHTPGGERTFRFELDLSDMEFAGRYPISRPVIVEGVVRNRAELLSLELTAYTTLDAVCDRCAEPFSKSFRVPVSHILVNELNNEDNDEYIVVPSMELDIEQLTLEDIYLYLPSKLLCKEDCKGVCPSCGANLNKARCSCKKAVDPRFEALLSLLDE